MIEKLEKIEVERAINEKKRGEVERKREYEKKKEIELRIKEQHFKLKTQRILGE
jgi:hypothetical protein